MACCVLTPYVFCTVDPCNASVQLPVTAPVGGIYSLVLDFLGTEYAYQSEDLEEDAPIVFNLPELNEYYEYKGKVIAPNGDPFTFTEGSTTYDGIQFETRKRYSL